MMKKLVALHGGDHKTGTTMLAQSLAELIALRKKDMKVLLIAAIPELKAVAWAASVRAATRRSRLVTVGFSTRE